MLVLKQRTESNVNRWKLLVDDVLWCDVKRAICSDIGSVCHGEKQMKGWKEGENGSEWLKLNHLGLVDAGTKHKLAETNCNFDKLKMNGRQRSAFLAQNSSVFGLEPKTCNTKRTRSSNKGRLFDITRKAQLFNRKIVLSGKSEGWPRKV